MKQYLIIPTVIAGWCGCLCAGGAALAPGGNCHVKACDVLRSEWTADGGDRQNNGVFSGVITGNGTMRHNVFEDIRVDGQCFRFIAYSLGNGVALQNFTFKNIWFEEPTGVPLGLGQAGNLCPIFSSPRNSPGLFSTT